MNNDRKGRLIRPGIWRRHHDGPIREEAVIPTNELMTPEQIERLRDDINSEMEAHGLPHRARLVLYRPSAGVPEWHPVLPHRRRRPGCGLALLLIAAVIGVNLARAAYLAALVAGVRLAYVLWRSI